MKQNKEIFVFRRDYPNKDGIQVDIVKAPKWAKSRADVIRLCIVKKGKKLVSECNWYTPDEAMAVARGLFHAVNEVMDPYFNYFREEKERNK